MIPTFPKFRPLKQSDSKEVEYKIKVYPPYSDFNFVSMWSWNTKEEMQISLLHDNLVVKFNDYITGEPFLSFLGKNKISTTIKTLLEHSRETGLNSGELKLVPEHIARKINTKKYQVLEDPDHHDYIIHSNTFGSYNTKRTRTKKNSVKKFLKEFTPTIRELDISKTDTQKEIVMLFEKWSKSRDHADIKNESSALKRCLKGFKKHQLCVLGLYVNNKLSGFTITELLPKNYACIHFCKADTSISSGVYAYMLMENARLLIKKGRNLINIEQDLGIKSMRQWKASHDIHSFLKKYKITYNKPILK